MAKWLRHRLIVISVLVAAIGGCSGETDPSASPGVSLVLYEHPKGAGTVLLGEPGRLAAQGRCLVLISSRDGTAYDLVWPSPATAWDPASQTVTLGGVAATIGDEVTLTGGPTRGRGDENPLSFLNPPPRECISEHQWVVGGMEQADAAD